MATYLSGGRRERGEGVSMGRGGSKERKEGREGEEKMIAGGLRFFSMRRRQHGAHGARPGRV
jgi:hypothetical protein